MISIWVLIALAIVHFVADFCLQSNYAARNKSTSNLALAEHVFIYSVCFWLVFGWKFALITAVTHGFIDWNTSRVTSALWKTESWHMFFVVVGFDQLLHLIQLTLTAAMIL